MDYTQFTKVTGSSHEEVIAALESAGISYSINIPPGPTPGGGSGLFRHSWINVDNPQALVDLAAIVSGGKRWTESRYNKQGLYFFAGYTASEVDFGDHNGQVAVKGGRLRDFQSPDDLVFDTINHSVRVRDGNLVERVDVQTFTVNRATPSP